MLQLLVGGERLKTALPVSVTSDLAPSLASITQPRPSAIRIQSVAFASFIAAKEVRDAKNRDDIARSRLLSVIRISAGAPRKHLESRDDVVGVPHFGSSPLGTLGAGVVPPPLPEHLYDAVAGHQCIPLSGMAGGGSLFVDNFDVAPLPRSGEKLSKVARCVLPSSAGPCPVRPHFSAAGWWHEHRCVAVDSQDAPPAVSRHASEVSDSVVLAAVASNPADAKTVALRAILDVLRQLIAGGVDLSTGPADFEGLESGISAARAALADVSGSAVARDVFARVSACFDTCRQTAQSASGLARRILSNAAKVKASFCRGDAAASVDCSDTVEELAGAGALLLAMNTESKSTGMTGASARATCRAAVCGSASKHGVKLPGVISKAPLQGGGLSTYSSYDFRLECRSRRAEFDVVWFTAPPRGKPGFFKKLSDYGYEAGRGAVRPDSVVAPCPSCPKDGVHSVSSCLCVELSWARNNMRRGADVVSSPTLRLAGIDAATWNSKVDELRLSCPRIAHKSRRAV